MSSVSEIYTQSKKRAMRWLVMALVAGVGCLLVWVSSDTPKALATTKSADIKTQDLALPKSIELLNQFAKEVPPVKVSTTVVRDMRNYPVEFKDRKFFEKHKNRWTVQVMDVAQNDIITGYLKGRNDRDKFTYFRYQKDNGLRYILTYGIMGSEQEAKGAVKTVDFGLPNNVIPTPEKLGNYLGSIDKYERTEEIVDSSPTAPRKVKLQPTRTEIPAVPRREATAKATPKKEAPKKPVSQVNTEKKKEQPRPKPRPKTEEERQAQTQAREERRERARERAQAQAENRQRERERPKEPRSDNAERQKRQEERAQARERAREKAREQRAERQAEAKREEPRAEPKPKREAAPMTDTPKTPGSDS